MRASAFVSAVLVITPLGSGFFSSCHQWRQFRELGLFHKITGAGRSRWGRHGECDCRLARITRSCWCHWNTYWRFGRSLSGGIRLGAAQFCSPFLADVLNGVPSITWGVVVYGLVVLRFKGFSAYAGGLALGLIMIPLILRTTEEVVLLVPNGYREAALALGVSRWKTIVHIVMKTASKGIITGILLALARVGGETAPLLFTAFGNRFWNHSLSQPIAALPLQIFTYAISPYDDWHRQAWAGALVLVTGIFCVNVLVRILTRGRGASVV